MATGLGKANTISANEAHNPAPAKGCVNIRLSCHKAPSQEKPTYVFPLKPSVNDKVADPSYTGDCYVKAYDHGVRIVDRAETAKSTPRWAAIPRWAARLFAVGNAAAIGGLLAVCITQNSNFLLVIAAGLAAAAIGLREAEEAVERWKTCHC